MVQVLVHRTVDVDGGVAVCGGRAVAVVLADQFQELLDGRAQR